MMIRLILFLLITVAMCISIYCTMFGDMLRAILFLGLSLWFTLIDVEYMIKEIHKEMIK